MPSSKNPELAALQQIVTALESLNSEAQDRVLSSVLALLGRESQDSLQASGERRRPEREREEPQKSGEQRAGGAAIRPKGLTELLREKNPGTNSQRIAVFAYYRDNYEHKPRFGKTDLEAYFGHARLDPPGNYDRDFKVAVEKGWIHENGDQSYITTTGIEAVEGGFQGERSYARPTGRKKSAVRKKQASSGSKRSKTGRKSAKRR